MGLFSFLKGQFIEVIEWIEDTESLVYRFPAYDNAIKMGAQLTVREGQAAIFLNEGKIADVFFAGRYELSTQNMPVLTALMAWKHAFNSPFKADVYFVNTTLIADQKWGTTNPIIMRDKEFGVVRARGFGNYSYRIVDPAAFMMGILGSHGQFTPDQVTGYFKTMIVSGVTDLVAELAVPIIDLARSYDELGEQAVKKLKPKFTEIGLQLTGLVIENISLPDEVEAMIDRRSSMNIAGDLNQYTKFQAAESMREMANKPDGGMSGFGMEFGASMAMGQMFQQAMNAFDGHGNQQNPAGSAMGGGFSATAPSPAPANPPAAPGGNPAACVSCKHALSADDKFCPECGTARPERKFCPECGKELASGVKFCTGCGTKL
ncbi:SPFH domain-containing protein [Paenibacillus glycinis]|uniref:Zinc-ribbon domain-containing protein n=1 Tax=Paenibacillus glycinis TaxID=2697035 RepID=A0ABW9XRT1_9BACL|nr:SPFH domain-containing protein [Paenibacillus glycinis]NBD25358.1 zinc-ribbon domain-containing protein [Paenibacillus glycinis]